MQLAFTRSVQSDQTLHWPLRKYQALVTEDVQMQRLTCNRIISGTANSVLLLSNRITLIFKLGFVWLSRQLIP